jgi:hypothetical protein
MTKAEFIKAARECGKELAVYAAQISGVSLAQVQLWSVAV